MLTPAFVQGLDQSRHSALRCAAPRWAELQRVFAARPPLKSGMHGSPSHRNGCPFSVDLKDIEHRRSRFTIASRMRANSRRNIVWTANMSRASARGLVTSLRFSKSMAVVLQLRGHAATHTRTFNANNYESTRAYRTPIDASGSRMCKYLSSSQYKEIVGAPHGCLWTPRGRR